MDRHVRREVMSYRSLKKKWTSDLAPSLWDGFSSLATAIPRNHRKCLGEK